MAAKKVTSKRKASPEHPRVWIEVSREGSDFAAEILSDVGTGTLGRHAVATARTPAAAVERVSRSLSRKLPVVDKT